MHHLMCDLEIYELIFTYQNYEEILYQSYIDSCVLFLQMRGDVHDYEL